MLASSVGAALRLLATCAGSEKYVSSRICEDDEGNDNSDDDSMLTSSKIILII